MSPVQIVTDSTADIPASLVEELDITVVPCLVYFGPEVFRDGVDLAPESFFHKLAQSDELPRTSQPPVADFVAAYRRLLDDETCEGIVSVHVAKELSGTVNAAWAAAQTLDSPSRVEVIDSGQLSMGLGWAVIEAARLACKGAGLEKVSQKTQDVLPLIRTAAMIDTLENLYKGGRISVISAALGTALQVKPLLSVQAGQVSAVNRVRTRSRALKRLAALVRDWGPLAEMALLHTGAEPLARQLADLLADRLPAEHVILAPAGPALTTHLGLGAVGVCAVAESAG